VDFRTNCRTLASPPGWRLLVLAYLFCAGFLNPSALCAENSTSNSVPLKYEEPRFLRGRIDAKGADTNLLFTFTRQATRSGASLNVLREYAYPDGKLAARERVVYTNGELVSFALEELQIGASGRAEIRSGSLEGQKRRVHFEYAKDEASRARPQTASEQLNSGPLVNDMIGPFLLENWNALIHGEELQCRYIVVPRRETVGFTLKKASETTWGGRNVVTIRMQPTSRIIAALVDPVLFTVETAEPHRVLEYVGRTTPKLKVRGKWKDLDAVTVFDWQSAQ